eukprot:354204-Chlamydomonas_euryale.AAC.3
MPRRSATSSETGLRQGVVTSSEMRAPFVSHFHRSQLERGLQTPTVHTSCLFHTAVHTTIHNRTSQGVGMRVLEKPHTFSHALLVLLV